MTQAGATNLASHPRRAKALELMLAGLQVTPANDTTPPREAG